MKKSSKKIGFFEEEEDNQIGYSKSTRWNDTYNNDFDDYHGYGYNSGKKHKKSYYNSWDRGLWSGYSWGTSFKEDDNSNLFVKDPVSYITPSSKDIKDKAKVWNEKHIDTIKELSRVCYFKMIDDRDYISEKFSDFDSLSESDQANYNVKKSLYDDIFENFIPGFTPLEQAISIFRRMSNEESSSEYSETDDMNFDPSLSFDRRVYSDPTINEQLNFNEISKNYKIDILNKVSIIGDFGVQFKVEKEVTEKIVSNSDKFSKKIMRDYSQFSQLDLYQKMLPSFRTKFLTKDLTINAPVEREEKKQKMIILLDYSGSMDDDDKQVWVNAILIDRLKYVMQGEAEVFFSYFVHGTSSLNFKHLKNREDVMSFWSTFSNHPNGGTTDIGGIVTYIDEEVNRGRLHNLSIDLSEEKPEILIINDGQDSIGYDKLPYKVNAISLDCFSSELKDLCVGTDGKQVYVDIRRNEMKFYEKGAEMVKLKISNK